MSCPSNTNGVSTNVIESSAFVEEVANDICFGVKNCARSLNFSHAPHVPSAANANASASVLFVLPAASMPCFAASSASAISVETCPDSPRAQTKPTLCCRCSTSA